MTLPFVSRLWHLPRTESTQTLARRLAEDGAEDRTLVWADRQTRGRGRLDRTWDSRTGGLYFSLVLKPRFRPAFLADFSLLTARATAASLNGLSGIRAAVKPPNDVFAAKNGSGKLGKIGGILAEASGGSKDLDWLVLGVGLNVNNAPKAAGAVSLKALTGRAWSVEDVLRSWLEEFQKSYESFP